MKQELRLIVTQACNFDCYFCHHEGIECKKNNLLDSDDYKYLYSIANKYFGITTVTITGGEPLILNNIEEIARKLAEEGCDITIVTNGSLLSNNTGIGNYIDKLNISLHSLNKDEYEKIVGRSNVFDRVIENIKKIRMMYPDLTININYALINSNDVYEKISKIIDFANVNNINVKFIELFPKSSKDYLPLEKLHEFLIKNGHLLLCQNNRKNKFTNGNNSFIYTTKCLCSRALDFASPADFCKHNNDLFIAQDGKVKLCRLMDEEVSLLEEIKNRDDKRLTKKLTLSFKRLGDNCPYERS